MEKGVKGDLSSITDFIKSSDKDNKYLYFEVGEGREQYEVQVSKTSYQEVFIKVDCSMGLLLTVHLDYSQVEDWIKFFSKLVAVSTDDIYIKDGNVAHTILVLFCHCCNIKYDFGITEKVLKLGHDNEVVVTHDQNKIEVEYDSDPKLGYTIGFAKGLSKEQEIFLTVRILEVWVNKYLDFLKTKEAKVTKDFLKESKEWMDKITRYFETPAGTAAPQTRYRYFKRLINSFEKDLLLTESK